MKIKATINYDTKATHPDTHGVADKGLSYTDTYTIDPNYFYGREDIDDYIKNDLGLVAGGGYNTDHIENVNFTLEVLA